MPLKFSALRYMLIGLFMMICAGLSYAEQPLTKVETDEPAAAKNATAAKRLTVNGVTITFTGDNEAVVEANGQLIKLNTANQSVVDITSLTPATPDSNKTETAKAEDKKPEGASSESEKANSESEKAKTPTDQTAETTDEIDPETYYGYELVNVPTPRTYEKGAFSVHFTHRFSQSPFVKAAPDLFGFDSFSASGLGFSYGITKQLYAKIYRTPINRTIEMGGGYNILHQSKKMPVSAAVYASVEGRDNFNEQFTTNIAGMIGTAISRYGSVFFSPTVSFNNNPLHKFNPKESNTTGSFGFGGQINFRPTASFIVEFTPRNGYLSPGSVSEVAFGIQKRTYRHVFTLTLSNSQSTTTSQYNAGFGSITDRKQLSRGLVVGFNIYRRFF